MMKAKLFSMFLFFAFILGNFVYTVPETEFQYPDYEIDNSTFSTPANGNSTIKGMPSIKGIPTIAPLDPETIKDSLDLADQATKWPQYARPLYLSVLFGGLSLYWLFAVITIASMFCCCYPFYMKELKNIRREGPIQSKVKTKKTVKKVA